MLRTALTALLLLTSPPAFAACGGDSYIDRLPQAQQDEIAKAIAATPYAQGLLWELTRGDQTLTLVGTMHIYDTRLTALFDKVAPTLRAADLLLVEATDAEMSAMQQALAADPSLYLITDGPTLPDLLAPEVWEQVKAAAAARNLPGFMVAQMQPWYLALTLGIPPCAMADLAAGKQGLDHMLSTAAAEADIPTQALESWDTLIAVLGDGTIDEQIAMMRMGLISPADQQAIFVTMLDAYFAEEIAIVWEISTIAAKDLSQLSEAEATAQMLDTQEVLLNNRNRDWIPVIEAAMSEHDTVVVAVGAAHLPGDMGLLALLRTQGWTAKRIY